METSEVIEPQTSTDQTLQAERTKIFFSYSRQDQVFVTKLVNSVRAQEGFHVFLDTDDILPSEAWRQRLENLIGEADTIVICLSPHSASSEVCRWELQYAERLHKRIVPVIISLPDAPIPDSISSLQYIFFNDPILFRDALLKLISAIKTDINWIREHTRLSVLAERWYAKGKLNSLLLRDHEIDDAEKWSNYRPSDAPKLTPIMTSFIRTSRSEHIVFARRVRKVKIAIAGLAVIIVATGVSWLQQDFLNKQYQWRIVMRPRLLASKKEKEATQGYSFEECINGCPRMITIGSGSFIMGKSPNDPTEVPEEEPAHRVIVPRSFAISISEITNKQWKHCVDAGGCQFKSTVNQEEMNHPVTSVTWQDTIEYVNWLSDVTGRKYRLPSEAEWEYAARAGSNGAYPDGVDSNHLKDFAWYVGSDNNPACQVGGPKGPCPVCTTKSKNAWGLCDTLGNVSEWVQDCYYPTYNVKSKYPELYETAGPLVTPDNCLLHPIRGGYFDGISKFLRLSNRGKLEATSTNRLDSIGFRIARDLH